MTDAIIHDLNVRLGLAEALTGPLQRENSRLRDEAEESVTIMNNLRALILAKDAQIDQQYADLVEAQSALAARDEWLQSFAHETQGQLAALEGALRAEQQARAATEAAAQAAEETLRTTRERTKVMEQLWTAAQAGAEQGQGDLKAALREVKALAAGAETSRARLEEVNGMQRTKIKELKERVAELELEIAQLMRIGNKGTGATFVEVGSHQGRVPSARPGGLLGGDRRTNSGRASGTAGVASGSGRVGDIRGGTGGGRRLINNHPPTTQPHRHRNSDQHVPISPTHSPRSPVGDVGAMRRALAERLNRYAGGHYAPLHPADARAAAAAAAEAEVLDLPDGKPRAKKLEKQSPGGGQGRRSPPGGVEKWGMDAAGLI